jgi:hypothetical protein
MPGDPLAPAKTDLSAGFRRWCVPAPTLKVGGQINASNNPRCKVVSVTPIEGIGASRVVVELTDGGRRFVAKVPDVGTFGCNCDFRPA